MNSTESTPARARREFWRFMLFALILLGAGIGLRDPWPADEPRFALSAQQMVASGDWLIPHRGSELYADKPPTFMALQAAAFEVVRNWRIAFLLPSLLAALFTLYLVYDLGRRLWDHRGALYAAIALLSVFQFVYQAKRAQIDPTVMFFITLANYGLLRHFLLGPNWRMYWLGCFAAGLGVITKGVGVLALLMFLPYAFARWQRWDHLAAIERGALLRWTGGALAFLLAIALWLVPMLLSVRARATPEYQAYAHDILFRQTAQRYAESWVHQQPWWYFFGVIAFAWLPLWPTWFGTIPLWWQRLRAHDARFLLPLSWVVLVIFFFSIPAGKRDMYIMPALPLVALCSGPFLPVIIEQRWFRIFAVVFITAFGLIVLGGGLYAWSGHLKAAHEFAQERGLADNGAALWQYLIATGAVAVLGALVFRLRRGTHALLAGLCATWLLWSLWGYPVLNDSSSGAGLMRKASAMIAVSDELGMVAWSEQNLLMAPRPVIEFGFTRHWSEQLGDAIRWQEASPDTRWVFILADAMSPCVEVEKARYVGHANRREWWLFRADAIVEKCRGGKVPAKDAPATEAIGSD